MTYVEAITVIGYPGCWPPYVLPLPARNPLTCNARGSAQSPRITLNKFVLNPDIRTVLMLLQINRMRRSSESDGSIAEICVAFRVRPNRARAGGATEGKAPTGSIFSPQERDVHEAGQWTFNTGATYVDEPLLYPRCPRGGAGIVRRPVQHAGMIIATADLLGTSQVPPTNSPATGFATIQVDTVAQTIHYDESYKNLEANAIASHIHFGVPIVNGPIILPFTPAPTGTSGEIMGTLTAADLINQTASGISTFQDIVTALEAGNLYVNLHTTMFPGGEIRGQLSVVPDPPSLLLASTGLGILWLFRRLRYGGRST